MTKTKVVIVMIFIWTFSSFILLATVKWEQDKNNVTTRTFEEVLLNEKKTKIIKF